LTENREMRGRPARPAGGQTGQVTDVIRVDDPADPRLADYLRLTDSALRTSLEAANGLFIAEGEKVIRRAIGAGYPVRSLLVTPDRVAGLADLTGAGPVYVIAPDAAERLAGYRVHRGALASMARRPLPGAGDVVAGHDRILVLEDLVDHGNVGAIFRCAAALGVGAVVLAPRCADPLYRRAVKVSMGAVFAVPYARMTDWYGGLAGLRAAGFRLLALVPDQSAAALDRVVADRSRVSSRGRVALLLGSEGDGLSARWRHEADENVCIPMSPRAMALGVDSLNVVAAAAVACYALMGGSGVSAGSR
jgi:tRNA G18 (ribose-2'-O)-methylase SpoU